MLPILLFAAATMIASGPTPAAVPAETRAQKDARMQWWREARFGLFIHWGLYAVPAGTYDGKQVPNLGEWIMNFGEIPVATYADYAKQFNPVKFNADEWVSLAKAAGMKYIVITAKHHDGFAMFKSADPFNIVDATPFHRDPIKELSDAAAKQGIKFGLYYSQDQDWHHPGGGAYARGTRKTEHWDPAQDGDFTTYLKNVAVPQVREILTQYHPAVLWWDTPKHMTPETAALFTPLLSLDPGLITNNRLGGKVPGDTETPEQKIPATGYPDGRDWETCMTINDTWGYKSYDTHFKSTETLLRNLIDIASKGGNYLLNVGPTAEGEIPGAEAQRLREMGQWMAVNGEAIYGTGPNPFPAAAPVAAPASAPATSPATAASRPRTPPVVWDWRATTRPGVIYLHIFQWPANGKFQVPPIPDHGEIAGAYLLADPAHAAITVTPADGGGATLTLPAKAPDAIASVIVLRLR